METELRPFMRVLVRHKKDDAWHGSLFIRRTVGSASYECINGNWEHCIHFNGNEHFLGKSADPAIPMKLKKGQFVAARNESQHAWELAIYDTLVNKEHFVKTSQNGQSIAFKECVPAEMIWPQE